MELYPNFTVFIQIASFLFLLFVLNLVLYRPIRKIVARRSEKVNSLHESIGDFRERSEQYGKELEEGVKEARGEGFKEKNSLKKAGALIEREVVQKAISSAEEKIGKAKDGIERSVTGVRQSLEDELSVFAKEVAEKILGRSI
jgi:F-type H+-transporting ATPase subunit b